MRSLLWLIVLTLLGPLAFSQSSAVSLLHATRGQHAGIYNEQGRRILLRGVNYNALGDYWQALPDVPAHKEYDDKDIEMMAEHGFNCVRLIFSWSALEPQRGHYDTAYIARISRAIEVAARYDMYVLIDMHQDAWGKYIATPDSEHSSNPAKGWDGAPQWATITDGRSTHTRTGRESAPAVFRAFDHFWEDTDSLQEACIKAWQTLVLSTAKYNNVVGYDLLNEPNMGETRMARADRIQGRYYRHLISGIRDAERQAHAPEHIIFFEVNVTLRGLEWPSVPYTTFRPERNIVFSPHHYFESLGDQLNIRQGFGALRLLGFFYHTDMLIGEWGFFNGAGDTSKVKRFAEREDHFYAGSTWWQWSQACGDPHSVGWHGDHWEAGDRSMHLIELDRQGHFTGRINEPIMHILDRTRPLAICGKLCRLMSNTDNGDMYLKAGAKQHGTVTLWIQGRWGKPEITGTNTGNISIHAVPGGYKADIDVTGKYDISVHPIKSK